MEAQNEVFQLQYNNNQLVAEKMFLNNKILFRLTLPDGKGFFVTKAKDFYGKGFWTSVPEGNPDLAEQVGILIEDHYMTSKVK